MRLRDLPEGLQRQVLATLAREAAARGVKRDVEKVAVTRRGRGRRGRRGPNENVARFERVMLAGRGALYEGVSFRLPGGSRYTPDWVVFDEVGRLCVYEVKGERRLGSEGRAWTAFREARAAFPQVRFFWYVADRGAECGYRLKVG